ARRGGVSDPRPAEARRRRALLPCVARGRLDRRRHVRAAAAAAPRRPRAHRRQSPPAPRHRRGAGVPPPGDAPRRPAHPPAARVPEGPRGGGVPEIALLHRGGGVSRRACRQRDVLPHGTRRLPGGTAALAFPESAAGHTLTWSLHPAGKATAETAEYEEIVL